MNYDMDQVLSSMGGKRANYSLEEIEAAKRRQKTNGGTIIDNLEAIKQSKSPKKTQAKRPEDLLKITAEDINKTLKDLNANIESDFGFASGKDILNTGATQIPDNATALNGFAGMQDTLKEKVYGQDEFIKKLVIAFKRPFVSERDNNDALNSIFITGPECTGKHYALNTIAEELGKRKILTSSEVYVMDLSLYPTAAEDKLFLQDLYSALQSKASVILFENYENCHVSMLTRLSDLVTTGEYRLSERYIMQKGQLVSVSNALAGETVGSFEAKGKYLVFMGRNSLE